MNDASGCFKSFNKSYFESLEIHNIQYYPISKSKERFFIAELKRGGGESTTEVMVQSSFKAVFLSINIEDKPALKLIRGVL